jgi:hypothetical protein
VGTASDSLELFELMKLEDFDKFETNTTLRWWILSLWSISLLQFVMVLPKRIKESPEDEENDPDVYGALVESGRILGLSHKVEEEQPDKCCEFTLDPEFCEILAPVLLQDGPFLGMRLYVMLNKCTSTTIIFYICKNIVLILCQLYRLYVLNKERKLIKNCCKRIVGRFKSQ